MNQKKEGGIFEKKATLGKRKKRVLFLKREGRAAKQTHGITVFGTTAASEFV